MERSAVQTLGLTKRYGMGESSVVALDDVTLKIPSGSYVSIVGPSGSGKSTLFNLIGGLDRPTSGHVYIGSVDVGALNANELAKIRRQFVGYIFQTFNLISVRTALENVALPMLIAGMTSEGADERAAMLLERVGLGGRLHHRPNELSGGQQQRVAVARALANAPSIILADEPTGNLDAATGQGIVDLLRELRTDDDVTVISATHDTKMIDNSDFVIEIRDGRIVS